MKDDKIYRRPTQMDGMTPHTSVDIRKRDITISFRVSEKERDLIYSRIYASGMNKSDFFIESCLYQAILVRGNIRTFTHIWESFDKILAILKTDPQFEALPLDCKETLRTVTEILQKRLQKELL